MAELAELFKPPPLLPRTETSRRNNGDRKKRKSQADGGEAPEGGPKKKSKKSANTAEQAVDGEPTPKPKKPRASKAKKAQNAAAQPQDDNVQNALLNLSPLETARRHEEASKKLRDNGIDPDTLSAEQFNIFANQSPDLQLESLAMLVRYGAERLRIVHPNKDNTSQSGTPDPSNGDSPTASTKKKRKKPSGDGAPKVKKTRGSCQACRAKKIKASGHAAPQENTPVHRY